MLPLNINFPTTPFRLFIDVGTDVDAPVSQEQIKTYHNAFVIGIEPNPMSCEKVRGMELDRFHLVEAGISDTEEILDFNVMGPWSVTSSFLEPTDVLKDKGHSVIKKVRVPTIRLDTILDEVPWDLVLGGVFYLKSDTQGFEDKVIKSLGIHIGRVQKLQIESYTAGSYENASNHEEVVKLLEPYMVQTKNDGWNAWFTKKKKF